jgi:TrmH family RNA methyltransferase
MPTASHRPHIRIVQSRQNSRVKELRAGFARGNRAHETIIAVEGVHLVEEALRCGLRITTLFIRIGSEALLARMALPLDTELLELPADIFDSAVSTEAPQGIAALLEPRVFQLADLFAPPTPSTPLLVIAAALQDPGNLGTLIRSTEAFGGTGLIALPGTVSQWNPKTLRASSGSALRLPIVPATESESLSLLRERGIRTLAATVTGGADAAQLDLTRPIALLIGNEGAGLSDSLIEQADERITIPFPGPVESLNAAIAGSILLYEAARQRRLAHRNQAGTQ